MLVSRNLANYAKNNACWSLKCKTNFQYLTRTANRLVRKWAPRNLYQTFPWKVRMFLFSHWQELLGIFLPRKKKHIFVRPTQKWGYGVVFFLTERDVWLCVAYVASFIRKKWVSQDAMIWFWRWLKIAQTRLKVLLAR